MKKLHVFQYCAGLSLLLLTVVTAALAADGESKLFVVSAPPASAVQYVHAVRDGMLELKEPASFDVSARIEPVTVAHDVVAAHHDLTFSESIFTCREYSCEKQYRFDLGGLASDEFDHLRLAWRQSPYGVTPQVAVAVALQGKEMAKPVTITGEFAEQAALHLVPKAKIDLRTAAYEEKSRLYLVKRELGLQADARWRYSRDADNLVLQARVDLPLEEVQAMQLVVEANQPVERIQFALDTTGNGRRDRFVLYEQVTHSTAIRNGLQVITVDFSKYIAAQGIDVKKAVLLEPIIFLPINFQDYSRKKPIHAVEFFSVDEKDEHGKVVSPQLTKSGNLYSLDFDFSQVADELNIWDGAYHSLTVSLTLDGPQVFSWQGGRFYGGFAGKVPALALQPEEALRGWLGDAMPELAANERISSFRPLMRMSYPNGVELSPFAQLSNDSFHDGDLGITGSNLWYKFLKDEKSIQIEGLFTAKNAFARIRILPRGRGGILSFGGGALTNAVVAEVNGEEFDLPLSLFLKNNQLRLPPKQSLTLLLQPVRQKRDDGKPAGAEELEPFVVQQWGLTMSAPDLGTFIPKVYPRRKKPAPKEIWRNASDSIVRGQVWAYIENGNCLQGDVIIKQQGRTLRLPVEVSKNIALLSMIPRGAELVGIEPAATWLARNENNNVAVTLLDVVREDVVSPLAVENDEWWLKQGRVSLFPDDNFVGVDQKKRVAHLFIADQPARRWQFSAPKTTEFIQPLKLFFPQPLPPMMKATALVDGMRLPFVDSACDLSSLAPVGGRKLRVEFSYSGYESLVSVPLPVMEGMGLRQQAADVVPDLLFGSGADKIRVSVTSLLAGEGRQWQDLGRLDLKPGRQALEFTGNMFYRFKTIKLATETPLPLWGTTDDQAPTAVSLWKRLARLTGQLMFWVAVGCGLFLGRRRIKVWWAALWLPVWGKCSQWYGRVSDGKYVILWFLAGCGLYGIGFSLNGQGENYGATFGGLCLVAFWAHLGRLMRTYLYNRLPRIAPSFYGSKGSPFFAGAIMLLVATAFFVAVRLEPIAEQLAIIVYYLLVTGVAIEVVELKQNQNASTEMQNPEG